MVKPVSNHIGLEAQRLMFSSYRSRHLPPRCGIAKLGAQGSQGTVNSAGWYRGGCFYRHMFTAIDQRLGQAVYVFCQQGLSPRDHTESTRVTIDLCNKRLYIPFRSLWLP